MPLLWINTNHPQQHILNQTTRRYWTTCSQIKALSNIDVVVFTINDCYHSQGEEIDNRFNPPNCWESSFHSDIPELHGTLSPEDFTDWLNTVEEILMFRQVPDDMQVPLVATRFKGRAMGWRQQLKQSRRQHNKPSINSWACLTKHMRRAFLPYNYEHTLYKKFQNLQQGTQDVE